MEIQLVGKSVGFAAGSYGPIALSVWNGPSTPEHARQAAALLAAVARAEDKILMMAVLGPEVPPPDAAVREILSEQIQKIEKQILATANVIEGQGFRAATIRAVITGMGLVIRPPYPQKVFARVEQGAAFLAENSQGRLSASNVVRAVHDLRSHA
jgi:hypothetical protein